MTIFYLPIEPYKERYTWQLKDWTVRRFEQHRVDYKVIEGEGLSNSMNIDLALPLDPLQRSHYALTQMANLMKELNAGRVKQGDVVYLQDMFHPGYSALPYVMHLLSLPVKIFVQNCAQSMDIYDFTYDMRHWMRHYEMLVDRTVSGVFVASQIHYELMRVAMFDAPIYKTALPFDAMEVRSYVKPIPWPDKQPRVVFTSRFDKEKQPHFFMDLVDTYHKVYPETEFHICTGSKHLKSTDPSALERARKMQASGQLFIHEDLSKRDYYTILNDSQLHLHTSLQDFWSNTLNEAAAYNVPTLAPAFRSFPEALDGNPNQLYVPWSIEDAVDKMAAILENKLGAYLQEKLWRITLKSHNALSEVIYAFQGSKTPSMR